MKLLYPDPHPVPGVVPEALQILHTVHGLGECGAHPVLLTPQPSPPLAAEGLLGHPLHPGVTVRHLFNFKARWWYPSGSNRPFFHQVVRELPASGADALLVRNLKLADHLLGRLGNGIPLFFETHELFAQTYAEEHPRRTGRQERKLAALAAMEERVYRHSRGIVALTGCLVEAIRERYRITTPCLVAPDGVDRAWLNPAAPVPPTATSEPVVLLYLGSLHPWKGVETLLMALPHLSGVVLRIAGGPAARQGELAALAARLGVAGQVEFLGQVPPGRRFGVIREAEVCLLPLTRTSLGGCYTSPLKLFEYLAGGKAVVAADLPAIREVLRDGEDALLVPPEDPGALARAIQRLVAEPGLRHHLGVAAGRLAREFTWTRRGERLLPFFAELASHPLPAR